MKLIQKIFSKDKSKLNKREKAEKWLNSHLLRKNDRQLIRDINEGNVKDSAKNSAKLGAIGGVFINCLKNIRKPSTTNITKSIIKGAIKGGLVTSALGASDAAFHKVLNKKWRRYKNASQIKLDRLDLAEGKMSEDDFIKKHYKD